MTTLPCHQSVHLDTASLLSRDDVYKVSALGNRWVHKLSSVIFPHVPSSSSSNVKPSWSMFDSLTHVGRKKKAGYLDSYESPT